MDIGAIRTIAIKSAEQYYNYLDSQETDKRRGETRYNVKKIEHFGCKQSYLPEDTLMI